MMMIVEEQKNDLWDKFNNLIVSYFETKKAELDLRDKAESILRLSHSVPSRTFHKNSKDQLGELYDDIEKALMIIRNDTCIFSALVKLIDQDKSLDKTFNLDWLSNDLIHFLLPSFTSPTDYYMQSLNQFKPLLSVLENLTFIANIFREERTSNKQNIH